MAADGGVRVVVEVLSPARSIILKWLRAAFIIATLLGALSVVISPSPALAQIGSCSSHGFVIVEGLFGLPMESEFPCTSTTPGSARVTAKVLRGLFQYPYENSG